MPFLQLKEKITELEDASLKEKSWQLKGEVGATTRPENSLLQEDLDFEHTTKQGIRSDLCKCLFVS